MKDKDSALEKAKQFLLNQDLVCFQDKLDACLVVLKRLVGLPDQPKLTANHINEGAVREKNLLVMIL